MADTKGSGAGEAPTDGIPPASAGASSGQRRRPATMNSDPSNRQRGKPDPQSGEIVCTSSRKHLHLHLAAHTLYDGLLLVGCSGRLERLRSLRVVPQQSQARVCQRPLQNLLRAAAPSEETRLRQRNRRTMRCACRGGGSVFLQLTSWLESVGLTFPLSPCPCVQCRWSKPSPNRRRAPPPLRLQMVTRHQSKHRYITTSPPLHCTCNLQHTEPCACSCFTPYLPLCFALCK
jgi:hypothetical protein